MEFGSLLLCLKTIGSVPPGGKLGHGLDNTLFVAKPGLLSSAWRIVLGEGRHKTNSTITCVLAAANERLLDMENSRFADGGACPERADLESRVEQLGECLQEASAGISNLQVTYATDCAAVAHLQVLHRKASLLILRATALSKSFNRYGV